MRWSGLRREIVLTLVVKLIAILALREAFFAPEDRPMVGPAQMAAAVFTAEAGHGRP